MIIFDNFIMAKSRNYLELFADVVVCFDKIGEENFELGVPDCWSLEILKKLNINCFDLYFIYGKILPHGKYNKRTDYQKIWGLRHVEKGEFDNWYDISEGRVYFGIKKGSDSETFLNETASVVILIPVGNKPEFNIIFNCFKDTEFDFTKGKGQETFGAFEKLFPDAIVLQYCITERASLSIWGNGVESLFDDIDVQSWSDKKKNLQSKY